MNGEEFNHLWFHLFIFLLFATIVQCDVELCTYEVKVKTGNSLTAGTDSVIGLTMYNSTGFGNRIKDLVKWGGTKGPNYNYFERSSLDEFIGNHSCLGGQICKIKLTSDGSGSFDPGWYCKSVKVETSTANVSFAVKQWLDTKNRLNAVKDDCGKYARERYWKG